MKYILRDANIIIIILLSYFSIAYFVMLQDLRELFPHIIFLPPSILLIGFIYIFFNNLRYKKCLWRYNLVHVVLYTISLTIILSITTFYAIDPIHSLLRILVSTFYLLVTLFVFLYIIQRMFIDKKHWRKLLSNILIVSAFIIIIGQLLIPDWKSGIGGVRLSGGTNPNLAGFFGFFMVVWSHFEALTDKHWGKRKLTLWILGITILFWSLSRSVILSFIILYILYFFLNVLGFIKRGKVKRGFLLFIPILIFLFIIFSFCSTFLFDDIKNTHLYGLIIDRISGTHGFETRYNTWKILLTHFSVNPLFGSIGWWYTSNLLSSFERISIAGSSHNLYVRLLSEVGIIGTVFVLIFPLIIFIKTLYNCLFKSKNKYIFLKLGFLSSAILALFVGQFFEDKYLVGIGEFNNSVVVWILALSLFHLSLTKNKEQEDSKNVGGY